MNPTGTEARVCADIADRQAKGTAKYGTTVQDNPLGLIQWLQHAYEECLDQAVYLKRAMELLQGAQPIPSSSAELEDPHAELRKTWREGQVWEVRSSGSDQWRKVLMDGRMQPAWYTASEYRRHPEEKDAEPTTPDQEGELSNLKWIEENGRRHEEALLNGLRLIPDPTTPAEVVKATFPNPADPHAELKAIYQPGMLWKMRAMGADDNCPWTHWAGGQTIGESPGWARSVRYEIHPDDLPKPQPKEEGWITVPDDCMEMPQGLKADDMIATKFSDGDTYMDPDPAGTFNWGLPVGSLIRVAAYKIIKPAE